MMMLLGRSLGHDPATVQVLDVMSLAILPATLLILCDGVFVCVSDPHCRLLYGRRLIVRSASPACCPWGYGVTAVVATLVGALWRSPPLRFS